MGQEPFNITVFSVGDHLDTSSVKTAGQYIVLHHLVRPLTTYTPEGLIQGEVLKSWKVKESGKRYILKINLNQKWSDGSSISVQDVEKSLRRQMKLNTAIHFNFSSIEKLGVISNDELEIVLKNRNVLFIRELAFPEFGVVKENSDGSMNLKVTSGAYSVKEFNDKGVLLSRNKYFDSFQDGAPDNVFFSSEAPSEVIKSLDSKDKDFVLTYFMTDEQLEKYSQKDGYSFYRPHIGYSYFLNINPQSKALERRSLVALLQMTLNGDFAAALGDELPKWQKAKQLYLPDGLGRPSDKEIQEVWDEIQELSKKEKGKVKSGQVLHILGPASFPFIELVKSSFKNIGFEVDYHGAKNIKEFTDMLKKAGPKFFDLYLKGNDYSSLDLHSNLQTTFSKNHPVIITSKEDDQYEEKLLKALNDFSDTERHEVYKGIAKEILLKGYIIPLAYQRLSFICKDQYDISLWSKLYPEISTWKIRKK